MTATSTPIPSNTTKVFTTIKSFSIENFKGIPNLSAVLDGKSCVFYSMQDGGKTCASEHAIQTLIQKFKGSKLRDGATDGKLEYELSTTEGEYFVSIQFNEEGKETISVFKDGSNKAMAFRDAISFLKSLQSDAHSMDINAIFEKTGKERAKEVVKQLGIQYEDEQHAYDEAFEERKNVGVKLRDQESRVEIVLPIEKELASKQETDISKLSEDIRKADQHNRDIDQAKQAVSAGEERLSQLQSEKEALIAKLQEVENNIHKGETFIQEKKDFLKGKHKVITESLTQKLESADDDNKQIRAARAKVERAESESKILKELQKLYDEADSRVTETRKAMFAKANDFEHGIEGLEVQMQMKLNKNGEETKTTEVVVKYNGLDFSDTEIAEGKIWAMGLKLKAARLQPGQLGFFRMQANLLDNANIIRLAEECGAMGIQIGYELNTQSNKNVQITTDISELISRRI